MVMTVRFVGVIAIEFGIQGVSCEDCLLLGSELVILFSNSCDKLGSSKFKGFREPWNNCSDEVHWGDFKFFDKNVEQFHEDLFHSKQDFVDGVLIVVEFLIFVWEGSDRLKWKGIWCCVSDCVAFILNWESKLIIPLIYEGRAWVIFELVTLLQVSLNNKFVMENYLVVAAWIQSLVEMSWDGIDEFWR